MRGWVCTIMLRVNLINNLEVDPLFSYLAFVAFSFELQVNKMRISMSMNYYTHPHFVTEYLLGKINALFG